MADQESGAQPIEATQFFHGSKKALLNLGGKGTKNRFLYMTPSQAMAREYGEVVTPIYLTHTAKVVDLSDPETLLDHQVALNAITDYATEFDLSKQPRDSGKDLRGTQYQ